MEKAISLSQIGLYNPQRQSAEVTEKLFVARQKQFNSLLEDILEEKEDSIPQHHLIIGQRGMGKTTLLKRLEVELHREQYRCRFIPLLFPEEQYNVPNLTVFWQNCLDALADALEIENYATEMVDRIDRMMAQKKEQNAENLYKYLMASCRLLHRRPVLLVDNIGLVFNRLNKHEQHTLRALLSENGAPVIIGAGVYFTEDVLHYDAPFYDFFQAHYLKKLSFEEFTELLENLAERTQTGTDITSLMRKETPRLKTLYQFTGGNPRTAVMLFKLLVKGFSADINDDLDALVDEVTPLYKAKFEELPQQQQIIIDAIAMNWDAIPLKELSTATHLENNQLSPQLKRLTDEGWIETTSAYKAKGNAYFISERFFNIWFLMRRSNRRQKRGIHSLSEFLECLYGEERMIQNENLHKALFDLHKQNQGLAKEHLLQAFEVLEKENKIASVANEYWWERFGYTVIKSGYASWFLAILEEKGYNIVLSPYYTALQALEIEKQDSKNGQKDAEIYLKNRAIEISEPARIIIERIRKYA